jgi:hypothetical protein
MGNTTVTLSGVLVRGGDIVLPTGESKVVSPGRSGVIGVTNIWFF